VELINYFWNLACHLYGFVSGLSILWSARQSESVLLCNWRSVNQSVSPSWRWAPPGLMTRFWLWSNFFWGGAASLSRGWMCQSLSKRYLNT